MRCLRSSARSTRADPRRSLAGLQESQISNATTDGSRPDANGQMGIPEHRYGWTKNKRSPLVRRTRLRTLRPNTISGRRRATFSASSRLFDLNGETNRVNKKQSSAIIAADVRRFSYLINTDEVFGTHRARRLKE